MSGNAGCCRGGVGNAGVVGIDAPGTKHRLGIEGAMGAVPDAGSRHRTDAYCMEEESSRLPAVHPVGKKGCQLALGGLKPALTRHQAKLGSLWRARRQHAWC